MSRSFSIPSLLLLSVLLSLLFLSTSAGYNKNAMLLQEVSTLVFTKGEVTNARRSSAVPQMSCKGGPCQYAPDSAMCRNVGWDGTDVTWKCEAELPKGVKFGKVEVSCEGFGSRDDELVLKGSCGLEYTLHGQPDYDIEEREEDSWWNRNVRGNAGHKTHAPHSVPPHHSSPHHHSAPSQSWWSWLTDSQSSYQHAKDYASRQYDHASHSLHHNSHSSTGLFSLLSYLISTLLSLGVKLIAGLIILFVLYKLLRPAASAPPPPPVRRQAPGLFRSVLGAIPFASGLSSMLGGAPSSYSAPYSAPPPPYPGHDAPGYNPSSYDKTYQSTRPAAAAQPASSGYGVMHGLLGGSLLGYLMGRRRGNQAQAAPAHTEQSSSSWFGGGQTRPAAAQTVHHVHHNAPPVNPEYVRRGGERYPTATSTTYESTTTTDVPDVKTTETTTAYARTKRR